MNVFFDSSSFAKRYVEEAGSAEVDEVLGLTSELGLSVLCAPEIASALNRRKPEGSLTDTQYDEAKVALADDLRDATLLGLTPSAIARSVRLLERNVLRAVDALHVASALEWRADLFVTSDRRQRVAAEQSGMEVRFIGTDHQREDGRPGMRTARTATARLAAIGFQRVGHWRLDGRLKSGVRVELHAMQHDRAIYAFVTDDEVRYVGVCDSSITTLADRMGRYQSMQGAGTNERIAGEVRQSLQEAATVEVFARKPEPLVHEGLVVDLVKGLENPLIQEFNPDWNRRS